MSQEHIATQAQLQRDALIAKTAKLGTITNSVMNQTDKKYSIERLQNGEIVLFDRSENGLRMLSDVDLLGVLLREINRGGKDLKDVLDNGLTEAAYTKVNDML